MGKGRHYIRIQDISSRMFVKYPSFKTLVDVKTNFSVTVIDVSVQQGIYRRCTLQIQRQLKIIELHTPLKYFYNAIQRCNRAQVQKCMQHHRGHLGAPLTTIHLY